MKLTTLLALSLLLMGGCKGKAKVDARPVPKAEGGINATVFANNIVVGCEGPQCGNVLPKYVEPIIKSEARTVYFITCPLGYVLNPQMGSGWPQGFDIKPDISNDVCILQPAPERNQKLSGVDEHNYPVICPMKRVTVGDPPNLFKR